MMVVWYVALIVKPSNSSKDMGKYDEMGLSLRIFPLKQPSSLKICVGIRRKKYVLLVGWEQQLDLNHKLSTAKLIHWNIALKKHRFLDLMRLFCELCIENPRVVWLPVIIYHRLALGLIRNRWLCLQRFAWETRLLEWVELFIKYKLVRSMAEPHAIDISVVGRWWGHQLLLRFLLYVWVTGNVVWVTVILLLLFLHVLHVLLKQILISSYFYYLVAQTAPSGTNSS